jgi:hypothetical protein
MVLPGMSKSFAIIPDSTHDILAVIVDGTGKGPVPSYTFENVQSNHTIDAYFQVKGTGIGTGHPGRSIGTAIGSCKATTPIVFSLEHGQTVSFCLTDIKGKIQAIWQQFFIAGEHVLPFKDSYLVGVYLLKVQGQGLEKYFKLIAIQ